MGWGFIDRIGEKLRQMKHGGTITPIVMPTGMPIIANSIRGIPTSIPQVDRIGSFKDGGSAWADLKNNISDRNHFKEGSVVEVLASRVPMLVPRPQIFNLRI